MVKEEQTSEKVSKGSGAFLSGEDLRSLVEDDCAVFFKESNEGEVTTHPKVLETDTNDEQWSDWAIDLTLGEEVFLTSDDVIRFLDDRESISINPGEFALLMTDELVDIPGDKAAFISLKFKYKRKGLINISGFHVDPNYKGRLVFSLYNASPSPVVLRQGDPVFMIIFATLTKPLDGNRIGANFDDINELDTDVVEALQGRTESLENLSSEVRELQRTTAFNRRLLVGIVLALLGGLVGVILGFFVP